MRGVPANCSFIGCFTVEPLPDHVGERNDEGCRRVLAHRIWVREPRVLTDGRSHVLVGESMSPDAEWALPHERSVCLALVLRSLFGCLRRITTCLEHWPDRTPRLPGCSAAVEGI